MAKVINLTADQQSQVKKLVAEIATAQSGVCAARKALDSYAAGIVPAAGKSAVKPRISVSDDGTSLIVG